MEGRTDRRRPLGSDSKIQDHRGAPGGHRPQGHKGPEGLDRVPRDGVPALCLSLRGPAPDPRAEAGSGDVRGDRGVEPEGLPGEAGEHGDRPPGHGTAQPSAVCVRHLRCVCGAEGREPSLGLAHGGAVRGACRGHAGGDVRAPGRGIRPGREAARRGVPARGKDPGGTDGAICPGPGRELPGHGKRGRDGGTVPGDLPGQRRLYAAGPLRGGHGTMGAGAALPAYRGLRHAGGSRRARERRDGSLPPGPPGHPRGGPGDDRGTGPPCGAACGAHKTERQGGGRWKERHWTISRTGTT